MLHLKINTGLWLLAVAPLMTFSHAAEACKVIRYSADGEPLCHTKSPQDPAKSKKQLEKEEKAAQDAKNKTEQEKLKNSWAKAEAARKRETEAAAARESAAAAREKKQQETNAAEQRERKAAKKAQKEQAVKQLIEMLGQAMNE